MMPPPRRKLSGPPPRRIAKPAEPAIPKRDIFRASAQEELFNVETDWQEEWKGMPEFVSKEQLPFHTVRVHLENQADVDSFAALVGQKITTETKYVWHPKKKLLKVAHLRYVDET